jgi:hypothetical protein
MPCLLGQPHDPFLEEEQEASVKLKAVKTSTVIFITFFIIFELQFKLFSLIIIALFL